MDPGFAKAVAGIALFVFISLGVFPLVQWFAFSHASGVIGLLFGHPGPPWTWVIPLAIAVVSLGLVVGFGHVAERR